MSLKRARDTKSRGGCGYYRPESKASIDAGVRT